MHTGDIHQRTVRVRTLYRGRIHYQYWHSPEHNLIPSFIQSAIWKSCAQFMWNGNNQIEATVSEFLYEHVIDVMDSVFIQNKYHPAPESADNMYADIPEIFITVM